MREAAAHAPLRLRSLRWRLLAAVCAAVLLLWLLTGWLSYTQAQHEAEELMDGNLAQSGRLLLALLRDNEADLRELAGRLATVRGAADNIYEPPLEFQIGRADGSILARSEAAPHLPVLGVTGYRDIVREDTAWRVLNVASQDGRYRVQVAQSIALRDRAALEVASHTVLPLALLSPVLIVLIYLSVLRALRPLDRLAGEISARNPDNLAPIPVQQVPTEALPLVGAINRLLQRVARTLDNERRFTADAAHELRTPLAALKVHTQVARLCREDAAREHALRQLEHGVDRVSRLVEQLLRLARLDPLNTLPDPGAVSLHALVDHTLEALRQSTPAAAQRITHTLSPDTPAVAGDADLLQIALRNLLDNALRYSPAEAAIQVAVEDHGQAVDLVVADNGPGVPPDALARLGERFFRVTGTVEGSGLGLAIVARIMALHGGRLALSNRPQGGLRAALCGLKRAAADCARPLSPHAAARAAGGRQSGH
ncbi:sensor histidine kinase [Pseudothauera hydrothermalis]|uniref:sensor histidine kinase n=1 Tax=Pseudothauera hydrothermalis TaxID=2184083 RepID=UPI0019688CC7|nr:sensor histidine kinase [Pseudothauera hydrothermalis]